MAHLLEDWEYQPGQVAVRKFKGRDGAQKLQLRVDLGILQMNARGRPDGKRPMGRESWFDHFKSRARGKGGSHASAAEDFVLTAEDCAKLQQEFIQYHHRYICLFQLEDYTAVVRDTQRNLQVLDFVQEHAASDELAWSLQQFRPQVLMMRVRAEGELRRRADDPAGACERIRTCLEQLKSFFREHGQMDLAEQSPEVLSLQAWLEEIETHRPLSEREKLERDLQVAVEREDYERAARVRDKLKNLRAS